MPGRRTIDAGRDRGQAHTLEGVTASLLLLTGLMFALQVTAVTPLSASTSNQHIENQQRATASGVLDTAANEGSLRTAVLFWEGSTSGFWHTSQFSYYTAGGPPNRFGELLNRSFDDSGVAFNVRVVSLSSSGDRRSQRMVYRGEPSDNAVTATRTVTLYDDDLLYDHESAETDTNVTTASFYADDAAPNSGIYNVVEVEVTAWRM